MAHIENIDLGRFPAYRRNLPHHHPAGFPLFFTWNLDGAVPEKVRKEKQAKRLHLANEPLRPGESERDRKVRHDKLLFLLEDQAVDNNSDGPHHLKDARAAQIVVDSILFGVPERYDLYAFVVMSNHVHLLVTPRWVPRKLTQGIKGWTSREINRLQNEVGRVFWQHESYDHWARDDDELLRIIEYIEMNPVKAGLCARPEDWLWSSATMRADWRKGQPWKKPQIVGPAT
jgi:putative transposase